MNRLQSLVTACVCLLSSPIAAFELAAPVDCELGKTCFIQQYVDHDPGPGLSDANCGPHTYDGHKGTDFALPDLAAMKRGVPVLVVRDGQITGMRDGMADGAFIARGPEAVKDRDCGNGVVITHEDGWTTQYCHLRKGSVRYRTGDTVKTGDVLGFIGLSGRTEFPHLHLQISKNSEFIDPFDGTAINAPCETERSSLWSSDSGVAYIPGGIVAIGIVDYPPSYEALKARAAHRPALTEDAPAMVIWARFYSVELNDLLTLELVGPNGDMVVNTAHIMEKNRASEMRFDGRKRRGEAWPRGRYTGTVSLRRNGEVIASKVVTTEIR